MPSAGGSLTGPQEGIRGISPLPADVSANLLSNLSSLAVQVSTRAHVSGHSVCVGLSGPGARASVFDMHSSARQCIVYLNSAFAWLAARLGVQL